MRLRKLVTVVVLGVVLGACGDSHEAVMDDQQSIMEEIFDVIEDVEDEESAKEAAGEIEALVLELADLQKRAQELPKPSEEELKEMQAKAFELAKEHGERSRTFSGKIMKYPALMEAFSKAGRAMAR